MSNGSPSPITNLDLIADLSRQRENSNWRFRSYIKFEINHSDAELDAIVHETAERISSQIDCTQCGNCCQQTNPVVDEDDIERLAQRMGMNKDQFRDRYVFTDEFHDVCLRGKPCPFLNGSACTIYDDRPKACRDFPYLMESGFRHRTINFIENAAICPIAFNTLEELKHSLGYLSTRRNKKNKGKQPHG